MRENEKQMIVSFDLDDTLFVNPDVISVEENLKFPFKLFYKERLRLGTTDLMLKIRQHGIKLWIYTTSFRSERYIRSYFKHYGIEIDDVVNGARHAAEVQGYRKESLPSKYPAKYRIDLHIDDDVSVFQNGEIYGFKVFLLNDTSADWHLKIWNEIERMHMRIIHC